MDMSKLGSLVRPAAIASHLLLAAVLGVAVLQWWKIPAQLSSGYVPDDYWLFGAGVSIPVVLAVLVLVTLPEWLRGRRWPLVATDLVVTFAVWPLLILIVVSADLPTLLLLSPPLGLAFALMTPISAVPLLDPASPTAN